MHRSLSVAAESAARESLVRRQLMRGTGAEEGSRVSREFLGLQAVIAVRALLEIWAEVTRLAAEHAEGAAACEQEDAGAMRAQEELRDSLACMGSGVCDMIASLTRGRPTLLGAVLHCGVPHWTSFRLLASSSSGVVEGIARHTHQVLALSLSSELASPLSSSSSALETWLWHVTFLLKVQLMQPQVQVQVQALSSADNAANRWICTLAESLFSFFKKSAHYTWWSVLPMVGAESESGAAESPCLSLSLGRACLDLLHMLAQRFPAEALKIIGLLVAADLPASHLCAPAPMRDRLYALQAAIYRRAFLPKNEEEGKEGEGAVPHWKRARVGGLEL
jgi:hypothetical protein